MSEASDTQDKAKRAAAFAAVDEFVLDKMVVGVGSGSTVVYAVQRLIQKAKEEDQRVICIPTSFQATQLITEGGLQLGDLSRFPEIDIALDGADEVDANLQLIKGGGACHAQEKIVAYNAKRFIVVADYRKDSTFLGEKWKKGVPIEVLPLAYVPVSKKITQLGGRPTLRMAGSAKAGPVVTDNGNFVIDADFGVIREPATLNSALIAIPGVVETGLFIDMTQKAFFGKEDGSIQVREKPK